jgi:hypothetical protein
LCHGAKVSRAQVSQGFFWCGWGHSAAPATKNTPSCAYCVRLCGADVEVAAENHEAARHAKAA